MVFHIHGGEGFPVLDKKAIFPDKGHFDAADPYCGVGEGALVALCGRVATKPMCESTALPGGGQEPFHNQNARNNLDVLTTCIAQHRT